MADPQTTRPLFIDGPWKQGFALDFHTSSSVYLGDDAFGHPVYDTTRTPLGDVVYKLKYQQDRSVLPQIATTLYQFLESKSWKLDAVVPMPPSDSRRRVQTAREIAEALGRLSGLPVCGTCLIKVKTTPQLKNVFDQAERERLLNSAFRADAQTTGGKRLLLLDDLYRSGATARTAARVLMNDGKAAALYFIAVTKTRKHA